MIQPSLALSQFKAQLSAAGIPCRLLNLNFELARRIGLKSYEVIARRRGIDTQIGEWLFARHAWNNEVDFSTREFIGLCGAELKTIPKNSESVQWLETVKEEIIPKYLDDCCNLIFEKAEPTVIAFSCVFYQTISALALARKVKERSESVKTLFGGACFHSEMGKELIEKTPWIDAVSIGEADDVIVELLRRASDGMDLAGLHGILYRQNNAKVASGPSPAPVSSAILESVPDPDYDDFIEDIGRTGLLSNRLTRQRIFLPFESSRGCWWGQKRQCAFCGLNAEGIAFRLKSPSRVVNLLEGLTRRYPVRRFFATDNNLPYQYYRNLLPRMKDKPISGNPVLFYEIKTNVNRGWVKALANARIFFIQPGIESLSTRLLKKLRKGVKAIKNVHLLKLCRTYGVLPMWNFLVCIPGEKKHDYAQQSELIAKIPHYFPPYSGIRLMQLHRFSPYYNEQDRFVENVRPRRWYAGLFPEKRFDLNRVAYFFDAQWKDTLGRSEIDYQDVADAICDWIDTWRTATSLPELSYDVMQFDGLDLVDTRYGKAGQWRLDQREALLYRLIDDPSTPTHIHAKYGHRLGSQASIEADLSEFVSQGIAMEDSGYYMGLALPNTAPKLSLSFRLKYLQHKEEKIKDKQE